MKTTTSVHRFSFLGGAHAKSTLYYSKMGFYREDVVVPRRPCKFQNFEVLEHVPQSSMPVNTSSLVQATCGERKSGSPCYPGFVVVAVNIKRVPDRCQDPNTRDGNLYCIIASYIVES